MSTPKPTVLESLQIADQLLQENNQHKTTNQPKKKTYLPPKWLMGNEILYSPKKRRIKNNN